MKEISLDNPEKLKFDRMLLILRWWFEIMIAFNADDFLDNICH
jgi:hypothetical protein